MQGDSIVRIGIIALITAFLAYLAWSYSSVINLEQDGPYLLRGGIILLFLVPLVFAYKSSSQLLKHIAAWLGIALVIAVIYVYKDDVSTMSGKLKSQLTPSSGAEHADGTVSFVRSENGHFYIDALVNTVPIRFMVDTGATKVSLSRKDAQRLGFDVDTLAYDLPTRTANGETYVASIRLAEIKVNSIAVQDVSASVSKNLSGESLLGMSFLKKLNGFTVEGNKLILIN